MRTNGSVYVRADVVGFGERIFEISSKAIECYSREYGLKKAGWEFNGRCVSHLVGILNRVELVNVIGKGKIIRVYRDDKFELKFVGSKIVNFKILPRCDEIGSEREYRPRKKSKKGRKE